MEKAIFKINFKETTLQKNIIGILVFPGSKLTAKRHGLELNQYIYG